jgi:ketosteroid isomerase-like protein
VTLEANVELVRAAFHAYNTEGLDGWMGFFSPDVEVFPDASMSSLYGPMRGRDEYRNFVEELNREWVDPRWEAVEVYGVGADRVLARNEWSGVGPASGIKTSMQLTTLSTIRDGQIARFELYLDHERALKAVGLEL